MPFLRFRDARSSTHSTRASTVNAACDELVRLWGDAAYDQANELSWKEDAGLLRSGGPGHWWHVREEIARRHGRRTVEPQATLSLYARAKANEGSIFRQALDRFAPRPVAR